MRFIARVPCGAQRRLSAVGGAPALLDIQIIHDTCARKMLRCKLRQLQHLVPRIGPLPRTVRCLRRSNS
jgi:hypothetical protein